MTDETTDGFTEYRTVRDLELVISAHEFVTENFWYEATTCVPDKNNTKCAVLINNISGIGFWVNGKFLVNAKDFPGIGKDNLIVDYWTFLPMSPVERAKDDKRYMVRYIDLPSDFTSEAE